MSADERETKTRRQVRAALRAAISALTHCYDSSEDNRNNPIMQSIGKALDKCRAAIVKVAP